MSQEQVVALDEAQPRRDPPPRNDEDEDTDPEWSAPPASKRTRIEPDTGAGSSSQPIWVSTAQTSLSAQVGGGWWLKYEAVKTILPLVEAGRGLVAFYNSIADKAAAQLQAGAAELQTLVFRLGEISLRLTGSEVVYWDWIMEYAMGMVDVTNSGIVIQHASTAVSPWQGSTIKIQLFLGSTGVV
ncbi:MAG: hypothetical protein Q9219_003925 [cf. Caloplaca sp. 3 TL-2023]